MFGLDLGGKELFGMDTGFDEGKSVFTNDLWAIGVKCWERIEVAISANLSSCNLARLIACDNEMGWKACTSLLISGFNPETKQLKKNGGGNPTILLARDSN